MDLTSELAREYLSLKRCPHRTAGNNLCQARLVLGACKYHMTEEQRALSSFVDVLVSDAYSSGWTRAHESYDGENSISRVGSGRVTVSVARDISKRDRICGRPRQAYAGACGNLAEAWADGCRHHLTPAEKDALVIGRIAWRIGCDFGMERSLQSKE